MNREELLRTAKPILFNTDMVRAILDGRKTATRRIIKPQPKMILCYAFAGHGCGKWMYPDKNAYKYWGDKYKRTTELTSEDGKRMWNPPYHTDDILYVRETWGISNLNYDENVGYIVYKASENEKYEGCRAVKLPEDKFEKLHDSMAENNPDWRPSIHMPKEATRIFLKVTSVLVERLQDITQVGAIDEGALKYDKCETKEYRKAVQKAKENGEKPPLGYTPIERFAGLWDSTIKKKDMGKYGWDSNPFVWVIEFERVMPDERPAGI